MVREPQVEDSCVGNPNCTTVKKASKEVVETYNIVRCVCLLNDASYLLVLFGVGVTVEVSFPRLRILVVPSLPSYAR
jgi:hypothetical protein